MDSCILCGFNATINRSDAASRTIYNCRNCGVFVISDLVENEVKLHSSEIMSFLTKRLLLNATETVLISFEKARLDKDYLQLTVDQIVSLFPTTFSDRIDMSLKNLELLSDFAGDEIEIKDLSSAPLFFLKIPSLEALSAIITAMQRTELIDVNHYGGSFFPCGIVISSKGWDRLFELSDNISERKSLFVCFSRRDKKLSEQFLGAVKKASHDCGMYISDISDGEGKISDSFVSMLKSSRTIVCDLTGFEPEVYYAAGFAKALGKTCIMTCNKSAEENLRIDADGFGAVIWQSQNQLYLGLVNAIKAAL